MELPEFPDGLFDEAEVWLGAVVELLLPVEVLVELLEPVPGIGTVVPEAGLLEVFDELEVSPGAVKLVELPELDEVEEFEELWPGEETLDEEPDGLWPDGVELLEEALESCVAFGLK